MVRMHERLHSGKLSADLRADDSYFPHMTIATAGIEDEIVFAETEARSIELPISGEVEAISIAELSGGTLAEVERVPLASA